MSPASPEALSARIGASVTAALELLCCYLGDRLGLYQALHDAGSAAAPQLAALAGTHPRYTREWLEQQAVAGFLACENPAAPPDERRFSLPEGFEAVLLDPESLLSAAASAQIFVGVASAMPELLRAFRTGAGIPFAGYGPDMLEGQARANRPAFTHLLAREWIAAMPDIDARLRADPPARIADVGMGAGWSSIALARAYPKAIVDGLDLDPASIAAARENARAAGLAGDSRLTFHVQDAGDPALAGTYDLALAIECIHDMANPVGALRAMRQLVGPGGAVLIVDERVQDAFAPNGDEVERMNYGYSVLHCLPVSMSEQPSAATGAVMRRAIFHRYASEAGFTRVDELPIAHETFRFYRLAG